MGSNDTYDLIEAYLQGKMSLNEQLKFEQDLSENSELKEEFQYHKLINDTLLDDRLSNVTNTLNRRAVQKLRTKKVIVGIVLLLFVLGIFYVFFKDKKELREEHVKNIPTLDPEVEINIQNKDQLKIKIQQRDSVIENDNLNGIHVHKRNKPLSIEVKDTVLLNDDVIVVSDMDSLLIKVGSLNSPEEVHPDNLEADFVELLDTLKENEIVESVMEVIKADSVEENEDDSLSFTTEKVYLEISPRFDIYEEFPFPENTSGILYIYTRNGDLVREMGIVDSEPAYWDGRDANGGINAGYYIFKFEGPTNSLLTGGITVAY